ncbi:amino acid ABC transporter substrate-binding protein [Chitinibacter bivalviorum]|uniref:Amino acid ABC transporter substrate-binding protein n=1 Tax=Chitinibacter bivalviorum TaxID=2739434 RepID=A0A7H9BMR3_9NEIS|nr:transporter substrate-binding domain-containing protein [Chitinibacter bivalviorum]QLG89732.1 amino acid ABC transporter substrate-binding protein [Chitinibacter bivalviorum]
MKLAELCLTALLTLSTAGVAAAMPNQLSICWEDGLKPPYLMLDAQGQVAGIAVDMVNEILRRQQIRPKHIIMPWKRCLAEVESGSVDLVPNSSYRDERAQYALFTEPLYDTHVVLFYNVKRFNVRPQIRSVDDMKRYSLGGILGFNYDQYGGQLNIDTSAKSRDILLRMMMAGRFDVAIEQLEVIQMMRQQNEVNLEQIAYLPDPVQPVKHFHILVSKKHPQAAAVKKMLDDGIAGLKRDGSAKAIQVRHLGE